MVDNMLFFPPCLPGQYPTQPTYPVQPPGNPVYPQTLHLPQAPPYTDAPPAYSEVLPVNLIMEYSWILFSVLGQVWLHTFIYFPQTEESAHMNHLKT